MSAAFRVNEIFVCAMVGGEMIVWVETTFGDMELETGLELHFGCSWGDAVC